MSVAFDKIKKARIIDAVIASVVIGVSFAMLAFGVTLLITKLTDATLKALYFVVICVGAAITAGGVAAIILVPGSKRLAKEIDESFVGGDRLRTMLEYENESGLMIEVQRADAESRLSSVPPRKPFIKQFLPSIVSLALGVVMLVTAIAVPKKQPVAPPPTDIPYEKTEFQVTALTALIAEIQGSKMQEDAKAHTVAELNGLLTALDSISFVSELTDKVIKVIVSVDEKVDSVNTFKVVATGIYETENNYAKRTARAMLNLSGTAFSQETVEIRKKLDGETFKADLEAYTAALIVGVATAGLDANEPLTAAFNTFTVELTALVADIKAGTLSEAKIKENTDAVFAEGGITVGVAINAQYENKAGRDRVKEQLMSIFGVTEEMLPKLKCDEMPVFAEDGSSSGNEQQGSSGGAGDGADLYGSNDIVFDPSAPGGGAYVKYGDAFDDYYKKIEELLLDGDLTPEAKKLLSEYFRRLSDATKAEEDGTK